MKKFFQGDDDFISFKDISLDQINFVMHIQHTTAGVGNNVFPSDIDWKAIRLDISRYHNEEKIPVYQGSLDTLRRYIGMNSDLVDETESAVHMSDTYVTLAAAVGVKEVAEIRLPFVLPTPHVLQGDDYLKVKVIMGAATFSGSIDGTVNTSYMKVSANKAIVEEVSIGVLETHVIEPNQDDQKVDAGDYVSGAYFISEAGNAGENPRTADRIIETVTFHSDKYNDTRDFNELLMQRDQNFDEVDVANGQKLTCELTPKIRSGVVLNDCTINLVLVEANVNASENYVLVKKEVLRPTLIEQGARRIEKHRQENKLAFV